jgi:hypothetical protein
MPTEGTRPPADAYSVWTADDAAAFLRERCQVTDRLPGFITENHSELFVRWREAIERGVLKPPFHVTHLDAHADLGLGDAGYTYLMSSLLYEPVEVRAHPRVGFSGLNDGNFLLFAIACRWISDLVYVFGEGGGDDELPYALQGFQRPADNVQLAAMPRTEIDRLLHRRGEPVGDHLEPAVPYRSTRWEQFELDGPFDFICLTRSPPYTPSTADRLYGTLLNAFIDPI